VGKGEQSMKFDKIPTEDLIAELEKRKAIDNEITNCLECDGYVDPASFGEIVTCSKCGHKHTVGLSWRLTSIYGD
jgi:uncharacterized paraquat-inducible protein A